MKYLSLFLAILLFCGIFAGCGEDAANSDNSAPFESSAYISESDGGNSGSAGIEESPKYIDYRIESYGFSPEDDSYDDSLALIRSESELLDYYGENGVAITDRFGDGFFDEKAVIAIRLIRGSGSIELGIKHIKVNGDVLEVTLYDRTPEIGTDDMQYRLITAEISQEDIKSVTESRLIWERQMMYTYYTEDDNDICISEEYVERRFGGSVEENNGMYIDPQRFNWLEVIRDEYELGLFTETYSYNGEGDDLLSYTQGIDSRFFESKAILALPYYSEYENSVCSVKLITKSESQLYIRVYADEREATGFKDHSGVIWLEVDKALTDGIERFSVCFEYYAYEFGVEPKDLEFSQDSFKACFGYGNHSNAADDGYTPALAVIDREDVARIKENLCDCGFDNSEFISYLESLDDEFFKDKALLVSFLNTDEGEYFEIESITAERYHGVPRMQIIVNLEDSVTPSAEEAPQRNAVVAVIDKLELLGCGWIDCDVQ